jgi:nucleotide-binding universal stress UspA family protein
MKILVCFRESDKSLLPLAAKHAEAFKGELLVVTALVDEDCKDQKKINEAEKQLAYAQQFFDEKSIACKTHLIARGRTKAESLLEFADDKLVEEIIIGVKRRSKVGKLVFGSTAQHIILSTSCPVVTQLVG